MGGAVKLAPVFIVDIICVMSKAGNNDGFFLPVFAVARAAPTGLALAFYLWRYSMNPDTQSRDTTPIFYGWS